MHALVDRGGQRVQVAWCADQERHLEQFERADQREQEDRNNARPHQRQRDPPESRPQVGARCGGRFLQRRVHGAEHRHREQKHNRHPQHAFDEDHAAERIELDRPLAPAEDRAQKYVDEAAVGPEQHDPADALDDHRNGERQEGRYHGGAPERRVGACHQPGRRYTERDRKGRAPKRVADRCDPQVAAAVRQHGDEIVEADLRLRAGPDSEARSQQEPERRQHDCHHQSEQQPDSGLTRA